MHGIKVNEPLTGTRPIVESSLAILGLIATATAEAGEAAEALNDAFPVGERVLVTDARAAIAKAGTGGTLGPALAAIADQTNPLAVVVRVEAPAPSEDPEAPTIDDAAIEGLELMLGAETQLGVRPRILGAPGLDTQPVAAGLAGIARKLRGFAYTRSIGDNVAEAVLYRANFHAREQMLIWPNTSAAFAGDAIARAMGLRARIDNEVGWHKTLSNVAMDGVTGLSHDVFFDLHSADTDAGLLNAADTTTLIRSNGFRFWGNRTCSDEPLFAFESTVRTAQALQDEIAAGLMWAIDKPITRALIRDIEETINARLRQLIAQGRLIGGRAWIDLSEDVNPPSALAAGKLAVDYDYTPCAPAESLTLNQRITDRYYAELSLAA
ncbi:MAG: phage tail protein [Alphaproteobacteria bacterium HGW-Alphaproteobacteria-13]|nr:MAG: phage tail protein [Alphaproteobacteria bacterium HGW-Alphaproteobacteria-13]